MVSDVGRSSAQFYVVHVLIQTHDNSANGGIHVFQQSYIARSVVLHSVALDPDSFQLIKNPLLSNHIHFTMIRLFL